MKTIAKFASIALVASAILAPTAASAGTWTARDYSIGSYASYSWSNTVDQITLSQSTTVTVKAMQSSPAGDGTWVQYQLRKVSDPSTYYYDTLKGIYSNGYSGTASMYVPAGTYYVSVANGGTSKTTGSFYLNW